MKKTIALVLCLILLSLAGCGRKDVVEEVGRSAQQDTTAQTEAPTQPPGNRTGEDRAGGNGTGHAGGGIHLLWQL